MINKNAFARALAVATTMTENGVALSAKPDSILSDINSKTSVIDTTYLENLESLVDSIEGLTTGSIDNPTLHDKVYGDVVDQLSLLVTTHVSSAKNTVKPEVVEFHNELEEFYVNNNVVDPNLEFNIEINVVPPVLTNESLLIELDSYMGKTPLLPKVKAGFPIKDSATVAELMKTGSRAIDADIDKLIAGFDSDFLADIHNSFFTEEDVSNLITYNDLDDLDIYARLPYFVTIYLIARKYYMDVSNEEWNVNLSSYKNIVAEIRDYAGTMITHALKNIALQVKTQRLVTTVDYRGKSVSVCKELYDQYLTNGGSPESLFGLIISQSNYSTLTDVTNKQSSLESEWNSYLVFYKTSKLNIFFKEFKEFVLDRFIASLKDSTDLEKDFITNTPAYKDTAIKLATTTIDGIKHKDLEDLGSLSLKLVAGDRFYFTSAFDILSDIQLAYDMNPNVDVREAALLAVINYITDFLADQIGQNRWN